MALPKLQHPTFEVKIPSTGAKVTLRPYTVKEQKILLTIKDSEDENEISDLLLQLISACCLTEGFNPKKLAYFDIEYLFLKLRAKSVGEVVEVSYKCNNIVSESPCGTVNTFEINLDNTAVDFEGSKKNEFEIQDGLTVKMLYPNLKSMTLVEKYNATKQLDHLLEAIAYSLDYVADSESVYDSFTKDEVKAFLSDLSVESFEKFLEFFISLPKIREKVKFKCKKCGYEDVIVLSGLIDFFV